MDEDKSVTGESGPPLLVRIQGSDWSLPAGPSFLVGRDPGAGIVVADGRVSWRHAVLRVEEGRWVMTDNGSTNGIYAGDRRVSRVEIDGQAIIRLSHEPWPAAPRARGGLPGRAGSDRPLPP